MNKKMMKKVLFVIVLFLFAPQNIYASSTGYSVEQCMENPKKCEGENPVSSQIDADVGAETVSFGFMDGIKMIFALIFVVALLYFLLKFINKRSASFQQNRLIQNLGGTALGANRSVQIVKVGDRILILGVGEEVRLIKEIIDDEERNQFIRKYNEQLELTKEPINFISKLVQSLKNKTNVKSEQQIERPFQSHFQQEMNELLNKRRGALDELQQKGRKKNE